METAKTPSLSFDPNLRIGWSAIREASALPGHPYIRTRALHSTFWPSCFGNWFWPSVLETQRMNVFELSARVGGYRLGHSQRGAGGRVSDWSASRLWRAGRMDTWRELKSNRTATNVLATWGEPVVTFSTHIDTVPPFFPSREDEQLIWGRGACDTKGIIASMIFAVEALLAGGYMRGIAMLFVVGEERNSAGALAAAKDNRGSRFIINGEPTENKLALGSKGALRYEVVASGRMAHSAYPHLGESAIEKLLDALERVRRIALPHDQLLGASTLNIGTIKGGRAPNVIPDHASAELLPTSVWWIPGIRFARQSRKRFPVWRRLGKFCAFRRCTWGALEGI